MSSDALNVRTIFGFAERFRLLEIRVNNHETALLILATGIGIFGGYYFIHRLNKLLNFRLWLVRG